MSSENLRARVRLVLEKHRLPCVENSMLWRLLELFIATGHELLEARSNDDMDRVTLLFDAGDYLAEIVWTDKEKPKGDPK